MDLKEKLRYYKQSTTKSEAVITEANDHLAAQLDGEDLEGVIKIHRIRPASFIIPTINQDVLNSLLLPVLSKGQFSSELHWQDLLFFDLETTGLAGGSGTYPFLLGFSWVDGMQIHSVQYFLPDYGREVVAYLDLKKIAGHKTTLVSYNGKSYDYPLLKNRFILNRFDNFLSEMGHFDLLHVVRRLWKHAIGECSLQNVENKIFHQFRVDDIDGAYIPQAYFDFLNGNDTNDIKRIIEHNDQDLLSLCRLISLFSRIENAERPRAETNKLCQIASENGDLKNATRLYELASAKGDLPPSVLVAYSLLLKKAGHWKQAVTLWEALIKADKELFFACEELSKFYEHRQHNIPKALKYTALALNRIEIFEELGLDTLKTEILDRFRHRYSRLKRKMDGLGTDHT